MNHQTIDFILLYQNLTIGKNWLILMGYTAILFNTNIQYSMSLPRQEI